jgi:hypothetical protein
MTKYDFKYDPDFTDFETPTVEPYEDEEVPASNMPDIDDIDDVDIYYQYFGSQVRVPIGDEIRSGKVMRHTHEIDGTVEGQTNANSMLDTRTYDIDFPDGCSDECTANVILENMYLQCDEEGNQFKLMGCIVDLKTDYHAVECKDMHIKHGSNKQVRKTTKGLHLCVEWKDGTTIRECLEDPKESNPVEVTEYYVSNNLHDVSVFL